MMSLALVLPLLMQAGFLAFDELILHRKRVLPQWERIGHPIDTASFLLCVLLAVLHFQLEIFLLAALLSCVLITKDEWVHKSRCSSLEMWVHSILFILHPICLYSVWQLSLKSSEAIKFFVLPVSALAMAFQIIYWNILSQTKRLT